MPGDTINILLEQNEFEGGAPLARKDPSISSRLLASLVALGIKLHQTAIKIDNDYKITEKVTEKVVSIDQKYEISSKTKTFLVPYVEKAKVLDGEYKVTETLMATGTKICIYAKEMGIRYKRTFVTKDSSSNCQRRTATDSLTQVISKVLHENHATMKMQ